MGVEKCHIKANVRAGRAQNYSGVRSGHMGSVLTLSDDSKVSAALDSAS